jgi:hypothetical protein
MLWPVLGLVNHPHSTGAQPFDDAVMGDGLTDRSCGLDHRGFARQRLDWMVEYSQARGSHGQPRFHFTPEIGGVGVIPACVTEERGANRRIALQRGVKQRLDPLPPVRPPS